MKMIKTSDLSADMLSRLSLGTPLLLCENSLRIERLLKKALFHPVNLNIELAHKFLDQESKGNEANISFLARQVISHVDAPLLLTNFEMLFDPSYRLDVIRLFIDLSRIKPLAVDCSTYFREGKLEYSEPPYEDHQIYELAAYAVLCVI